MVLSGSFHPVPPRLMTTGVYVIQIYLAVAVIYVVYLYMRSLSLPAPARIDGTTTQWRQIGTSDNEPEGYKGGPRLEKATPHTLPSSQLSTSSPLPVARLASSSPSPAAQHAASSPVSVAQQSTCSDKTSRLGAGQRVVSFNFYGPVNSPRPYFVGIEGNADAVRRIYPGWRMRLYHEILENDNSTWKELQNLEKKYSHLDLCNISYIPTLGSLKGTQPNAWRFSAMEDPLVDVFVSRDLDARSSHRERAAVDEWLASNLTFHVMRDHPKHIAIILAGMWGARMDIERETVQALGGKIRKAAEKAGSKSKDQTILKNVAWPAMKGKVMQHDSYTCKRFSSHGHTRPFPTQRLTTFYNFVGFRDQVDRIPVTTACPIKCRPPEHEDWKTC